MRIDRLAAILLLAATGCTAVGPATNEPTNTGEQPRLPTGARLDPAGRSFDVGSMPLAIALSPDEKSIVVLLNGWREQGLQVLDRGSGTILQSIPQPAAFLGLTFSPDGRSLYASGGNEDVIYRYAWSNGRAMITDAMVLAVKAKDKPGTRYPAGVGVSPDGKNLYVAENLADSLAVMDLTSGRVTRRLATDRYPYGVAVARDGSVYVSAWGSSTVSVFRPTGGEIHEVGRISVGRHPSALALSSDGLLPKRTTMQLRYSTSHKPPPVWRQAPTNVQTDSPVGYPSGGIHRRWPSPAIRCSSQMERAKARLQIRLVLSPINRRGSTRADIRSVNYPER